MRSMGIAKRLDEIADEATSRRPVAFQFDDRQVMGYDGEPVAIALLMAGFRAFARAAGPASARGGFCFTGRCADCLVIVDGQPDQRACLVPVREGMRVETQAGLGHWLHELSREGEA
ncbi:MAG: hypothetical protein C4346_18850 [Chloroflexota bacterium]